MTTQKKKKKKCSCTGALGVIRIWGVQMGPFYSTIPSISIYINMLLSVFCLSFCIQVPCGAFDFALGVCVREPHKLAVLLFTFFRFFFFFL